MWIRRLKTIEDEPTTENFKRKNELLKLRKLIVMNKRCSLSTEKDIFLRCIVTKTQKMKKKSRILVLHAHIEMMKSDGKGQIKTSAVYYRNWWCNYDRQ